jgi:hypothetical protein
VLRERQRLPATVLSVLQQPWILSMPRIMVAGLRGREGQPRVLPITKQEGRDFFLNSCLIRLIHLLSLYIERGLLLSSKPYLTPKQVILISN